MLALSVAHAQCMAYGVDEVLFAGKYAGQDTGVSCHLYMEGLLEDPGLAFQHDPFLF